MRKPGLNLKPVGSKYEGLPYIGTNAQAQANKLFLRPTSAFEQYTKRKKKAY